MKLGVTGTRDGLSAEQRLHAHNLAKQFAPEVSEFHYGDCTGVDEQFLWILLGECKPRLRIYPALVSEKWRAHTIKPLLAMEYGVEIIQYKPVAPKTRNGFIAEAVDLLLAFPGSGGGTWDCVRKAQALGREGWIAYQDGRLEKLCKE